MSWFRFSFLALVVLFPVFFVFVNSPPIADYKGGLAPPGQLIYLVSKAFGLIAVTLFLYQAITGLIIFMKVRSIEPVILPSRTIHQYIGIGTIVCIFAHVGLFVVAASIRTGNPQFGLLLPNFEQGHYRFMLSIGLIAMLVLVIAVTAIVYISHASRIRRWTHRLALIGFGLALWHAYSIGSEFEEYLIYCAGVFAGSIVFLIVIKHLLSQRIKDSTTSSFLD